MPIRSKVAVLPAELRNELERRIVERAFSGYQELADWLQGQGYHLAHDSIQRHGSRLRHRIEAMERLAEEAQAIAAAAAQAGENMVDATMRLIYQRVFSMLLEPEQGEGSSAAGIPACAPYLEGEGGDRDGSRGAGISAGASHFKGRETSLEIRDLVRLTRILADLNRITIGRQRHADEVKSRLEQQKQASRERETEGGLSDEVYHAIRNALLGIHPSAPEQREGASSAAVPACAPPSEKSGGESTAEIRLHPLPHPPPRQEMGEGTETHVDADRRASTLKPSSSEPLIDATPSDPTRLPAAHHIQVKCTAVENV